MRIERALSAIVALCLAMAACGASGDALKTGGETFVLKGTIRVVGSEPFTRLVLTVPPSSEGSRPTDHVVKGPLAAELRQRYQGKTVTVECRRCAESAPDRLPCAEPEKILRAD